ncbi:hypothetical protein Droror1_Dr00010781 [Drosera rotundifolia]
MSKRDVTAMVVMATATGDKFGRNRSRFCVWRLGKKNVTWFGVMWVQPVRLLMGIIAIMWIGLICYLLLHFEEPKKGYNLVGIPPVGKLYDRHIPATSGKATGATTMRMKASLLQCTMGLSQCPSLITIIVGLFYVYRCVEVDRGVDGDGDNGAENGL